MRFAGSGVEKNNFANPELAQSGFKKSGNGEFHQYWICVIRLRKAGSWSTNVARLSYLPVQQEQADHSGEVRLRGVRGHVEDVQ